MEYEIVIGLEVHVELKTESKVFCGCTTAFGGEPNTHCCPVCSGMPGVLPVLNKKAVEYAIKAGLATNCQITQHSIMDRKNYFYPDLPKAFQISQLYKPLCIDGNIQIDQKKIRIREIHLEEDAGKLIHDEHNRSTLMDFNRCGVPLIEIVTEPDIRSANEAKEFLDILKSVLEYTQISDCKMQEGSLRADVNVSVMKKGSSELGTRTEMKNLNSFKAIVRAIDDESVRQIDLLENGEKIVQETRRWDDEKGKSYSMRSKEEAHDYRYFPEPDLFPIEVSKEWLKEIEASIPELPRAKAIRYEVDFELPPYDCSILTSSKTLSDFFDETIKEGVDPKTVSNWLMGDYMKNHNENGFEEYIFRFSPKDLSKMIQLVNESKLTGKLAKNVFKKMYDSGKTPEVIIKEDNIQVISDTEALLGIVIDVIGKNPKSVEDFNNGKEKALGFLIGQVMRLTRGSAPPKIVNELIIETLKKKEEQ